MTLINHHNHSFSPFLTYNLCCEYVDVIILNSTTLLSTLRALNFCIRGGGGGVYPQKSVGIEQRYNRRRIKWEGKWCSLQAQHHISQQQAQLWTSSTRCAIFRAKYCSVNRISRFIMFLISFYCAGHKWLPHRLLLLLLHLYRIAPGREHDAVNFGLTETEPAVKSREGGMSQVRVGKGDKPTRGAFHSPTTAITCRLAFQLRLPITPINLVNGPKTKLSNTIYEQIMPL